VKNFGLGERAVITGLGFITPIGNDASTVEDHLRRGWHGFSPIEIYGNPNIHVRIAGQVKDFFVEGAMYRNWKWPDKYSIPRETLRGLAPHGVYAICALEQALADAMLSPEMVANDDRTGLYCASAGSGLMIYQNASQMVAARGERGNPMGLVASVAGTLNFNLAAYFRITGAVCGFVSACASSSHALGYALDEIRMGRLDRVLVVGAEDLNAESLLPFAAMRALSSSSDPIAASCPFDVSRQGFVGAGGAAVIVLESSSSAISRGARIYAELAGWGQAADGYSVASPEPGGTGLQKAIKRALKDAAVHPGEVDYVNAHATSTLVGDRAEALALREAFEGYFPRVSSTKGLTGHTLSMAGVLEAGICSLSIAKGFMPGNPHLRVPDEVCAELNLPIETVSVAPKVVLSNSSGFGGSNVCQVLSRFDL
jgi:3-oxoacyl-[acyl-carrier-protein] synthase-1